MDPGIIAHRLSKHFTPHVLIDDVPTIGFHGLKKKYKVSVRQYTGSKGYWVGTQIISLDRDAWNRVVNSFLKECCEKLDGKPNLRSHSFRIGFITQLWKDTSDLEFVRQVIGHASIDTTYLYVGDLAEENRQKRMLSMGKD